MWQIAHKKDSYGEDNDDENVKFTRVNLTLPERMRDEWKNLAKDLSKSVSQMVRDAVALYKSEMYNIEKLITDKEGILDQLGKKVEKEIEGIGKDFEKSAKKTKKKVMSEEITDTDKLKKRVKGLITLQRALPIEKLSHALEISKQDAENLIYELAAEGISGSIENEVFKYENSESEVISAIFKLIDNM